MVSQGVGAVGAGQRVGQRRSHRFSSACSEGGAGGWVSTAKAIQGTAGAAVPRRAVVGPGAPVGVCLGKRHAPVPPRQAEGPQPQRPEAARQTPLLHLQPVLNGHGHDGPEVQAPRLKASSVCPSSRHAAQGLIPNILDAAQPQQGPQPDMHHQCLDTVLLHAGK